MTYLIDQIILSSYESPPCATAELCNACRGVLWSDSVKLCDAHLEFIILHKPYLQCMCRVSAFGSKDFMHRQKL